MNASLQTSNGLIATTNGWDTVFAIPVTAVNQAIIANHSSPAGFSHSGTCSFPALSISYTITMDFGDWQITAGGDGKNIRLSLPLRNVVCQYSNSGIEPIEYTNSYPSGTATIEVLLTYLSYTNSSGGTSYKLVIKSVADTSNDPLVCLVSSSYEGNPCFVIKSWLDASLKEWCNANLSEFSHVFATIELNNEVDQNQWGFVAPNYTSYAYLDAGNFSDSLFAVLCMTGDRTGEGLTQAVNDNAIPTGSIAGFLISQKRTLLDLIRPAICIAYPGLTTDNLVLSQDETTLSLQDGMTVNLSSASHNGTDYYPVLKQLSVTAIGEILTLNTYTETVIDPFYGITATCTSTHWYTLGLGTSSSGQTLVFQESQPASIVHSYVQAQSGANMEIIMDVILALAGIILTILTSGAATVVCGLVVGLALGMNNIIPDVIDKGSNVYAPPDLLVVNSVKPIQWTGSKTFTLNFASLNGSLQMGGDPNFA